MRQTPSPDTRIATVPASTQTARNIDPGHGSEEHRSVNYNPAIRAPAFSRLGGYRGFASCALSWEHTAALPPLPRTPRWVRMRVMWFLTVRSATKRCRATSSLVLP